MGLKPPSSRGSRQELPSPVTVTPPSLTDAQIEILKAFRSELESEGHLPEGETLGTDDETLLRFLRARKFNLVQAKRMITQCLSWRHQVEGMGIDDLYREVDPFNFPQKEHVFKHWPMYYHRTDKLGRPINIQRFGSLDLGKLYASVDKELHFRSILVNCEALTREILPACTYRKLLNQQTTSSLDVEGNKKGLPVEFPIDFCKITNAFCIIDLKGFTLTQFWQIKSMARLCFSISQDYYPETMGYLAIINAPKSFATIFKAIQPWLSHDTIAKINILGDDYVTTLLEYIDAENLPNYLGGQCKCNPADLGNCNYEDPNFERSPWLRERDFKRQTWRKFGLGAEKGQDEINETGKSTVQRTRREEQDEVEVDGGMTQDGALIITRHKKSSQETTETNTPTVKESSTVPSEVTVGQVDSLHQLNNGLESKPPSIKSDLKLPPSTITTNDTDTSASLFTAQSQPSTSDENF